MKYLLILCLLPSLALAHEGHGGVGLFHHLLELWPVVLLPALMTAWWLKRRDR
ncbi:MULTISPECIES: hypothetical protein [Shewanella]|uniref:Uncharacterized protein n=2 Tax=Shewanella TaxID=22 RepID=A0A974XMT5_9GAMM|nr:MULTISPECIES: hypothetical protein [Shewanella]QSX31300.1 hypothetical protein JYB88_06615 [Shewanella cyperi]QSX38541.1 hypothetical protein JYB85_06930 [Shewanella sedimentimangrovi]QSX42085.1 hypothetical protein JYB84_06655 [Shewanella cyperi]